MFSTLTSKIYEFEDFRLIPDEGLLLRNGKPISLNPKAFAVLSMLVEHHGHLVSKSEILDAIWEGAFIEESAISKAVWFVRDALGDTSKEKFIKTVPRRGYRFVAPVSVVDGPVAFQLTDLRGVENDDKELVATIEKSLTNGSAGTGPAIASATEHKQAEPSHLTEFSRDGVYENGNNNRKSFPEAALASKWKSSTIKPSAFIAILLFASAIALAYFVSYRPINGTAVAGTKSIAVLPLKPVLSANRDEIYDFGIAESLILKLSSMKGIVVRPLSATRIYAGEDTDSLATGREQKVDYVLASHYQLADGKIRVTAQLINVASGNTEETYKGDKVITNVFAIQDAIAGDVANLLQSRFGTSVSSSEAGRGTNNEEAYRHYLTGSNILGRRNRDVRDSIGYFEQAIKLDPGYAGAWAALARAHNSFSVSPREDAEKARFAVNRALDLDNKLADAYSARSWLRMFYDRDFAAAESDALYAKELSPDSSEFRSRYAFLLSLTGRFDESVEEIKQAVDLDPGTIRVQRNYGIMLYYARRYDEAIAQLERVIAMDPNFETTYPWLWRSYELTGNYDKAFGTFINHANRMGMPERVVELRAVYKAGGWRSVLEMELAALQADEKKGKANYYQLAIKSARVEEKDKAFNYLERLFQSRAENLVHMNVEPMLDPLRDDPRFDGLLKRVGF